MYLREEQFSFRKNSILNHFDFSSLSNKLVIQSTSSYNQLFPHTINFESHFLLILYYVETSGALIYKYLILYDLGI